MRKKRALMDPRTAAETRHRQHSLDAVAGRIEALKRKNFLQMFAEEVLHNQPERIRAYFEMAKAVTLKGMEGAK